MGRFDFMRRGVSKATGEKRGPARSLHITASPAVLTVREREALGHLTRGLSTKEIAAAMGTGYKTADVHVAHLLAKLGAANRVVAAVWWDRQTR